MSIFSSRVRGTPEQTARDAALQCIQRMESEREQRQWAIYRDERLRTEAITAWSLLKTGLRHEVAEFNRHFQNAMHEEPLSIDDSAEAIILIRKRAYPLHETQIVLKIPERIFLIYRKTAPDGVTEPVESHEAVKLDLRSDDKLYMTYENSQLSAYDLPHAIMKPVFSAF
jgi:hypothetical protein